MARKRKRTLQSETKQAPFGTLREYTRPRIFGPVSVTEISATPEDGVQIRTFEHALAWAPELITLAPEGTGAKLP